MAEMTGRTTQAPPLDTFRPAEPTQRKFDLRILQREEVLIPHRSKHC